jgi:hypothetical protein
VNSGDREEIARRTSELLAELDQPEARVAADTSPPKRLLRYAAGLY